VLWKPSSASEPGWDSPWGRGRPGWHIECSAMSWKHLGETFDIHGGGIDLVFPHHENEIAQSRCCFETPVMANVWMHNGFLQVEGEKMSKSLGNFVTINELLHTEKFGGRKWSGEVLRLAMLKTHYRQPIDFSVRALEEAEKTLEDWAKATADVEPSACTQEFIDALGDDLNFARAEAHLHALRKSDPAALRTNLVLIGLDPAPFAPKAEPVDPALAAKADALVFARLEARRQKNWAESDRIRDELAVMGIVLKDNKDGTTTWEVKR